MNLILLNDPVASVRLERNDPRAQHLRKVLRAKPGTCVFIGFANGLRARAQVLVAEPDGGFHLQVIGTEPAPAALPITLLIGLPRPHTARRILFEGANLGVAGMHFFAAQRSEPSYAQSSLWQTNEWQDRLRLGAEQAFGTHLPQVAMYADLHAALIALQDAGVHVALDHYEAEGALDALLPNVAAAAVLALGPERGWSAEERHLFRHHGWSLAHLGPHVLRAETAVVAAVAATASRLGWWTEQTVTHL